VFWLQPEKSYQRQSYKTLSGVLQVNNEAMKDIRDLHLVGSSLINNFINNMITGTRLESNKKGGTCHH
jgi:hypothetical protein